MLHIACCTIAVLLSAFPAGDSDPWADAVLSYDPGTGHSPGYDTPSVALGPPARMSGETFGGSCVTPFNPAYEPDEIVSIGVGGSLVVVFAQPVMDDPGNPFGIDLLVFGNSFFSDAAWPQGMVAGLIADGGTIEISDGGVQWFEVPGIEADGLYPTMGFTDAGPYDIEPGLAATDCTRPVDPAITMRSLQGMSYEELLEQYDGSGGGSGIDIGSVGLTSVTHVRILGPARGFGAIEIDALGDVPPLLPEDVNGDGTVGFADLVAVLGAWGPCTACPADIDNSGEVDFADILLVLGAWS